MKVISNDSLPIFDRNLDVREFRILSTLYLSPVTYYTYNIIDKLLFFLYFILLSNLYRKTGSCVTQNTGNLLTCSKSYLNICLQKEGVALKKSENMDIRIKHQVTQAK